VIFTSRPGRPAPSRASALDGAAKPANHDDSDVDDPLAPLRDVVRPPMSAPTATSVAPIASFVVHAFER
jgi:hypothetical protein|tara:strand:+ start:1858 stop:2064 length:207 start_codon:yes stop_codon:yes gene_type:complete